MRPYSIDTDERRNVMIYIGGISALVALLVALAGPPSWVPTVSFIGLSSALYGFTDRWLWKRRFGPLSLLFRTPVLDGGWSGKLNSSYVEAGSSVSKTVSVKFQQSWTKIQMELSTDTTRTTTTAISIDTHSSLNPIISYIFHSSQANVPGDSLPRYEGTSVLRLSTDGNELSGHYYTGKSRRTYGDLVLKRG